MKKITKIFLIVIIPLSIIISGLTFWYNYTADSAGSFAPDRLIEERGKLVSYEYVATMSAEEVHSTFPEHTQFEGDIADIPQYDIDIYNIVYTSVVTDEVIELSGAIHVPKVDEELATLQYHHGTLMPYYLEDGLGNTDAPSLYKGHSDGKNLSHHETRLYGNYFASSGYMTNLPDYVGYGISEGQDHTYSVNNRLAEQSVDMILASKEFAKEIGVELNDKLFLTGASEGGAASVATQKLLESEYYNIPVTANAPQAGMYNAHGYLKLAGLIYPFDTMKSEDDALIGYSLWTIYAANMYSDTNPLPNDEIFKFEVNNQMDLLGAAAPDTLAESIKLLIGNRGELLEKFEEVDLMKGWTPIAPIYVHHGTEDDVVYFDYNADIFVEEMSKKGADVKLVAYEGHDHVSLVQLYLPKTLEQFSKY